MSITSLKFFFKSNPMSIFQFTPAHLIEREELYLISPTSSCVTLVLPPSAPAIPPYSQFLRWSTLFLVSGCLHILFLLIETPFLLSLHLHNSHSQFRKSVTHLSNLIEVLIVLFHCICFSPHFCCFQNLSCFLVCISSSNLQIP